MHVCQTGFAWPRSHFMDLNNKSTTFSLWNDCKVCMSDGQFSSDRDYFLWFNGQYLVNVVFCLFLKYFSNRVPTFGLWTDCKVCISDTSSFCLILTFFHESMDNIYLFGLVYFPDTLSNIAFIFWILNRNKVFIPPSI